MQISASFIGIPKEPRSVVYNHCLTADLFSLMAVCKKTRVEGLIALKKRLRRLSVPHAKDWGVTECKQAYLWHFGNPTKICDIRILKYRSVALTSCGIALFQTKGDEVVLTERTFGGNGFQRVMSIEGLAVKHVSNGLTFCRHDGKDLALVNRGSPSIITFDKPKLFSFEDVERATVDSIANTTRVATLKLEKEHWHVRWCQLASLLEGKQDWTDCRIPRKATEQFLNSIERAYLEFIGPNLALLKSGHLSESWSTVALINRRSAAWQVNDRFIHYPDAHSPLPFHIPAKDSIRRTIMISNLPCYGVGLLSINNYTIALWAMSNKESLETVPIRTFHSDGWQLFGTPVAVLTTHNGCWPVVAGIWPQNGTEENRLIVWRFKAPESSFADLELSPKISLSGGKKSGWGELLIERALRVNVDRKKWGPLLNSLWEDIQNVSQDPEHRFTHLQGQIDRLIAVAITEAQHDFLAHLFSKWLPLQSKNFEQPLLDEIFVKHQLIRAIQTGRTECAIELLRASGRQKLRLLPEEDAEATQKEQLDNWLPLQAAFNALGSSRWGLALPLLASSEIPDNLSPMVYRRLLNRMQTIHFDCDGEHGPAIRRFFQGVLKIEPRIANGSEIITLAALLENNKFLAEIEDPQIDLPPWAGDMDSWLDSCTNHESSIFFALRSFEIHPDRFDRFVEWLVSCDLADPVSVALIHFVKWTTTAWNRDNTQLLKRVQPKRRKLDDNL